MRALAGTFSGSTPALSAGCEILDMLQEGYLGREGRINDIHNRFIKMLNDLNQTTCSNLLNDAGGMGLMVAVTPYDGKKEQVDQLLKRMFNNGLIAFNCGKDPMRVRFLIPATIENKDIDRAKELIEKSMLEGV